MDGRISKAIQTLPGRFRLAPTRIVVFGPGNINKGRKQNYWLATDADYLKTVLRRSED